MKRYKQKQNKYQAVTLIEVILYIALTSSMLLVISSSFNTYVKTKIRASVREEVNSQARFVIQQVNREIAKGVDIVSPPEAGNGNIIEIDKNGGDPNSIISLSGNYLNIDTGPGSGSNMNSARTKVSALTVSNRSNGENSNIVTYEFTVEYVGGSAEEFRYSNTYRSSVSLKANVTD